MLYLHQRGTLAGLRGGRRRTGLGSTWDSRVHRYLGARSYELSLSASRSESDVPASGEAELALSVASPEAA